MPRTSYPASSSTTCPVWIQTSSRTDVDRGHQVPEKTTLRLVNYPDLPRSGLPGPRLLRSGLPVSMSELAGTVPTAAPDSAGDFPSRVVRSVPLLPVGHSTTIGGARFLSRLNTAGDVASIVLLRSTAGVVNVVENVSANRAALYPLPTRSLRSLLEEGGLAPQHS